MDFLLTIVLVFGQWVLMMAVCIAILMVLHMQSSEFRRLVSRFIVWDSFRRLTKQFPAFMLDSPAELVLPQKPRRGLIFDQVVAEHGFDPLTNVRSN